MPSYASAMDDIKKLSPSDKERLIKFFEQVITFGAHIDGVADEIKESRFSN